jgi:hypothetical protein
MDDSIGKVEASSKLSSRRLRRQCDIGPVFDHETIDDFRANCSTRPFRCLQYSNPELRTTSQ